jgi:hypothetical protein
MDETRFFEIKDGWGPDSKCVSWGLSRFGKRHDEEMSQAIAALHTPGDGKSFCVGFTPSIPKMHSPARVAAQRIRNMKARAAKLPLLADQIEAEEMKRSYFSEAEAERDQAERRAYYGKWEARFWEQHPEALRIVLPNTALSKLAD